MKLPRHPFPVLGRIEQCWLFAYRAPVAAVPPLLPPTLAPVTHGGWAFWNVVVCRLSGMRPSCAPAAVGLGYWHVAYRLHVRALPERRAPVEGLFFVRSDVDRRIIALGGNCLTDFNFHHAAIRISTEGRGVCGSIIANGGNAEFQIDTTTAPSVAPNSPFASVDAAAAALKYPPRALSPNGNQCLNVVRVERNEQAWQARPVRVRTAKWEYLRSRETSLEMAFELAPIDYRWSAAESLPLRCAS